VTSPVLLPRHVYALSLVLAMVGGVTAALTVFLPDVLTGPPVTNGNARGTALVIFAVATPVLVSSIWLQRRGSSRAGFLWLGSLFYLGYNAFLLLFLTPFNSLFLPYVVTQSRALFSIFALVHAERGFPTRLKSIGFRYVGSPSLSGRSWLSTCWPGYRWSSRPSSQMSRLRSSTA
jgi:hypothetical protein